MELTDEFRVDVPVEAAWAILNDVERVAPCLPGAQLDEVEGDRFRGTLKVKVGPITAHYAGTASYLEQDPSTHRVVLRAEGRDTRGQGNADATVTATMTADGEGTVVSIVTDLAITGKVAQFGRGVLADVSGKLVGQFVANLERDVLHGPPTAPPDTAVPDTAVPDTAAPDTAVPDTAVPDTAAPDTAVPDTAAPDPPEADPVDLAAGGGSPRVKRLLPLLGGAIGLLALWRARRSRRGRR